MIRPTVKLMKSLVSLITHCCTVVVTGTPTIANTGQIVCRRDVETLQRLNGHTHVEKTLNQRPNTTSNFLKILFCLKVYTTSKRRR